VTFQRSLLEDQDSRGDAILRGKTAVDEDLRFFDLFCGVMMVELLSTSISFFSPSHVIAPGCLSMERAKCIGRRSS